MSAKSRSSSRSSRAKRKGAPKKRQPDVQRSAAKAAKNEPAKHRPAKDVPTKDVLDFIVGGIPRSGTTALSIALCAHPDIYAYASETGLFRYVMEFFHTRPFPQSEFPVLQRQLSSDLETALTLHTRDFVTQQEKDIALLSGVAGKKRLFPLFDSKQASAFKDDAIKLLADGRYGQDLLRELSRFLGRAFRDGSGRKIVGEKTPDNLRAMADLHMADPNCRAIATIRDPFATLRSMAKRAARGATHDMEFSRHLVRNIGLYLDNLKALQSATAGFDNHPLLVIRYEDMLDDARGTMSKAFAHLRAAPDPAAVDLASSILRPRPDHANARDFFHPTEQLLISRMLGPLVEPYGYKMPEQGSQITRSGTLNISAPASDPELLAAFDSKKPMLLALSGFLGTDPNVVGALMAATASALLIIPDNIAEITLETWTSAAHDNPMTANIFEISCDGVRVADCELGGRGDRSVLTLETDKLPLRPLINGFHFVVLDFSASSSMRPIERDGDDASNDLREQSVRFVDVDYHSHAASLRRHRNVTSDLREQLSGQRHLIVEAERRTAALEERLIALGRELEQERTLITKERNTAQRNIEHERTVAKMAKAREGDSIRKALETEKQVGILEERLVALGRELENERALPAQEREKAQRSLEAQLLIVGRELEHDKALMAQERDAIRKTLEQERQIIRDLQMQDEKQIAEEREIIRQTLEKERAVALLNIEHERARAETILASSSWRLTAPLRRVASGSRRITNFSKRAILTTGKATFKILPLPRKIKDPLQRAIASRLAKAAAPGASTILVTPSPQPEISPEPPPATIQNPTAPDIHEAPLPAPVLLPAETQQVRQLESAAARFKQAAQRKRNRPDAVPAPADGEPEVSIIIPVYNQIEYTLLCIEAVQKYTHNISYEIIVVDDCSADETQELLSKDKRIIYHRNTENEGFIGTCHAGGDIARGRYLVFLNNDTEPLTNWLLELIETLEYAPDAGIAGAQLLYPDGRLQEAGGIVWQDGSAWNYGRLSDPLAPEVSYLREADYVSGAALAISKDLWERSGGFDFHYKPAYGEDSDLAFRLRSMGFKVYYQPLSKVIHYEGISSGTDVTKGIKAYQVENAKKLFERWQDDMARHRPNGIDPEFEKERGVEKRLLIIDACTPEPDKDAGSITTWEIMRAAQHLGYKVSFIPESNFTYIEKYSDNLARVGVENILYPFETSVNGHLRKRGRDYDAILIFRAPNVKKYLPAIKKYSPKARLILHASDLHFLRAERQAEVLEGDKQSNKAEILKQEELAVINAVDCTIVHSTFERDLLNSENAKSEIIVFPWIMDVNGRGPGFTERKGIMFLGGYQHDPNVDAVEYFARDILPLIKQQLPEIEFFAVGSNPPDKLFDLKAQGVTVSGFVEDLRDYVDLCRLAVVPLRYGAGIKGKLATSMSYGLPSISTTIGAEGMELQAGIEVVLADEPQQFAEAVIRLYQDEKLWYSVSDAGLDYVDRTYSRKTGRAIMKTILGKKHVG